MPIKFTKSTKKFIKDKKKHFLYDHDYLKQKTNDELFKYLDDGQKPKVKRKCRVELERRGIRF